MKIGKGLISNSLQAKIDEAHQIIQNAVEEFDPVTVWGLFSGGA